MNKLPLLVDSFNFIPNLVEDKSSGGKTIMRGEFARAGVATENNRVYPKALWEREIKRLAKSMAERKVYGCIDHPENGRTSLKEASHLLTKLWMEGDVVMGEAELLNNANGQDMKAIIEASGHLGVSSRGFGTTAVNSEGKDVVQDNYRLQVFDFVADPANTTSYPVVQHEEIAIKTGVVKENVMAPKVTLESLRQSDPKLVESLATEIQLDMERRGAAIWAKKIEQAREEKAEELKAVFAENLKAAIEQAKIEVAQMEREKLLNDPKVAGASSALEDIKKLLRPYIQNEDIDAVVAGKDSEVSAVNLKMADKQLEIEALKKENSELAALAKEAGYKYHLESLLAGNEYKDLITSTVGDVKLYESVDALDARVSEIAGEIKKANKKHEERDLAMQKLIDENKILQAAAEKAIAASKQFAMIAYTEERLKNHPKADEIRIVLESSLPETKEGIDEVISKFRPKKLSVSAIEEARARVRSMVGTNAREYDETRDNVDAKVASNLTESKNFQGLGQDLVTLRTLSGMGTDDN